MKPSFTLVAAFALSICHSSISLAGDEERWQIVPGKRIGRVALGMEHAEVMRLLGAPHLQIDMERDAEERAALAAAQSEETVAKLELKQFKGMIREDWITPLPVREPRDDDSERHEPYMAEFLTVYFQARRVVQIEVHASRFKCDRTLSTASSGKAWEKRFPHLKSETFRFRTATSGLASKHLFTVEDAIDDGISWRFGVTADLSPSYDAAEIVEVATVHEQGVPVVLDFDAGNRFMWKDYPTARSTDH